MSYLDENGMVAIPEPGKDELWAARHRLVVDCGLCDDDGYRGNVVCDHHDHTAAAEAGMKLVRKAMGWDT